MNALSTIFNDISKAINEKLPTSTTMYPSEMPSKIRSISTDDIPTERPTWDEEAGKLGTKFIVEIPYDNFEFYIGSMWSSETWTINWGDDTEIETYNESHTAGGQWNAIVVSHIYSTAGQYIINFSDNVNGFQIRSDNRSSVGEDITYNARKLQSAGAVKQILQFGSKINTLSGSFRDCVRLYGPIPAFPPGLKSLEQTFNRCGKLRSVIPNIPTGVESMSRTFWDCGSLFGTIPTLPPKVKTLALAFYNCGGLTGDVPEIPDTCTSIEAAFNACTGLTGVIQKETKRWPTSLTNVREAFFWCSSLEGLWETEDYDEYTPSTITSYNTSSFVGCNYCIIDKLPTTWGGTRTTS